MTTTTRTWQRNRQGKGYSPTWHLADGDTAACGARINRTVSQRFEGQRPPGHECSDCASTIPTRAEDAANDTLAASVYTICVEAGLPAMAGVYALLDPATYAGTLDPDAVTADHECVQAHGIDPTADPLGASRAVAQNIEDNAT